MTPIKLLNYMFVSLTNQHYWVPILSSVLLVVFDIVWTLIIVIMDICKAFRILTYCVGLSLERSRKSMD